MRTPLTREGESVLHSFFCTGVILADLTLQRWYKLTHMVDLHICIILMFMQMNYNDILENK